MDSERPRVPDASSYRASSPLALALASLVLALHAVTLWATFRVHGVARLPCSLANGFFIALAFAIGHDCCHGSFFAGRVLNRVAGRVLFLPALFPLRLLREWVHNHQHHGWTNFKPVDCVWVPFSKEEFDELGVARQIHERVGRTAFGVGIHYAVAIWWSHLVFPSPSDRRRVSRVAGTFDRILVLTFFVAEVFLFLELEAGRSAGALGLGGGLRALALGLVVPLLGFHWLLGLVTFLQHSHPRVRWYDRRYEWSSRERRAGWNGPRRACARRQRCAPERHGPHRAPCRQPDSPLPPRSCAGRPRSGLWRRDHSPEVHPGRHPRRVAVLPALRLSPAHVARLRRASHARDRFRASRLRASREPILTVRGSRDSPGCSWSECVAIVSYRFARQRLHWTNVCG